MSLYLKYRPQTFNDVIGQTPIVQTLLNALNQDRLVHAYLFCGPRGTGKTSMARIIAKSLNCEKTDQGNPCGTCTPCESIQQNRWVDLIEIDAASNRGIDEIRDLKEKINFSPTQGKVKIYIIDEVHMLTKEAFNALLKTLEEPPTHTYFILATTEAHKIPETISSRCQQFYFNAVSNQSMVERLAYIADQESIKAEPEALELIATIANGGLRDAISLFEQSILDGAIKLEALQMQMGLVGKQVTGKWIEAFEQGNTEAALSQLDAIVNQGHQLTHVLNELIQHLREHMLNAAKTNQPTNQWIEWIEIMTEAKGKLNQSITAQLPFEVALIKACSANQPAEQSPLPKGGKSTAEHFSLTSIQSQWSEITKSIKTPIVKMSLLDGRPALLENETLTVHFNSQTLMEKVDEPRHKGELIECIETIIGKKVELKLAIKKEAQKESTADIATAVFRKLD